jgi:hypothetical protein
MYTGIIYSADSFSHTGQGELGHRCRHRASPPGPLHELRQIISLVPVCRKQPVVHILRYKPRPGPVQHTYMESDMLTRSTFSLVGSLAAARSLHVTSKFCRRHSILSWALVADTVCLRCHDGAEDHPNEHANRMIWYVFLLFFFFFFFFFFIISRLGHTDLGPALSVPSTCKRVPAGVVHKHANAWEVLQTPRKYISTCTPSAAPRIPSPHAHSCTPLRGHTSHNGLRGVCMFEEARLCKRSPLQPLQRLQNNLYIDLPAFPLSRLAILQPRTHKLTPPSQRLL